MLKITAAQINPTIGDMSGNVARMIAVARQARADDAELVVLPELSLTAYYPGDLLEEEDFMERVESAFHELLAASRQMPALYWVIGLPVRHEGKGKRLRNALR